MLGNLKKMHLEKNTGICTWKKHVQKYFKKNHTFRSDLFWTKPSSFSVTTAGRRSWGRRDKTPDHLFCTYAQISFWFLKHFHQRTRHGKMPSPREHRDGRNLLHESRRPRATVLLQKGYFCTRFCVENSFVIFRRRFGRTSWSKRVPAANHEPRENTMRGIGRRTR